MSVHQEFHDLQAYAETFPDMGATRIGPWLRRWASECHTHIVEVGSWLGAGTAQLALGARESGAQVHTYDQWRAQEGEIAKAKRFGIDLRLGEDTLPYVRDWLAPFGAHIVFHQGNIRRATWPGGPIGLYVDDAAKSRRNFRRMLSIFGPYWADGCILVLMDYYHFQRANNRVGSRLLSYQYRYINARPSQFEPLEGGSLGSTVAAFRFRRNPKGTSRLW